MVRPSSRVGHRGEAAGQHTHPRPTDFARTMQTLHLHMRPLVLRCLQLLTLLSFFELPPWCAADAACASSLRDGKLTGAFESGRPFFSHNRSAVVYPLFGLPIAPPLVSSLLELGLLCVLVLELVARVGAQGLRRFFAPWADRVAVRSCAILSR